MPDRQGNRSQAHSERRDGEADTGREDDTCARQHQPRLDRDDNGARAIEQQTEHRQEQRDHEGSDSQDPARHPVV